MFNFLNNDQNQTQQNQNSGCACKKNNNYPTTYKECNPIVTCSEEVIDQYHITRQPYIHNYHTKVVHHYITENCFIPKYTCSEVHINEDPCNNQR